MFRNCPMLKCAVPRLTLAVLLTGGVAFGTGCATSSQSGESSPSFNVITREEIQSAGATNAQEVIRRLHPSWLRPRSRSAQRTHPRLPVVYFNDIKSGGPEVLVDLLAENIQEIRYMEGSEATSLYGIGYDAGVIFVTTRS